MNRYLLRSLISAREEISRVSDAGNLIGSELDWNCNTVPQKGLDNRKIPSPAGKALGGGTAINSCESPVRKSGFVLSWYSDSDNKVVGFGATETTMINEPRRSETQDGATKANFHTCVRPRVIGPSRQEFNPSFMNLKLWCGLLRLHQQAENIHWDTIRDAWASIGVETLPNFDGNAGSPLGLAELVENEMGFDSYRALCTLWKASKSWQIRWSSA